MIKLEELTRISGLEIIYYLNHDEELLKKLKSHKIGDITIDEFLDYNNKWCINRNGKMFCIINNNKAIGSISLSDIDRATGQASSGYWIASEYWGEGYGKEAFKEIVKIAKQLGIKRLNSKVLKDNMASRKVWGEVYNYR